MTIVLIPLGDVGRKFKSLGYKLPKPLVNVMGKPMICWLLDNLNLKNADLVLIPYSSELSKYRFADFITNKYPDVKIQLIKLDYDTEGFTFNNIFYIKLFIVLKGASETIKIALEKLSLDDQPILCLDGDNFYMQDVISR